MKSKRIIILTIIMTAIMSINYNSEAKYVFEYTKKAAEIAINN